MANDITTTRTNYFKVNNKKKFEKLMNSVCADELEVWTNEANPDLVGFGCYDDIMGLNDKNGDLIDDSFDKFTEKLAKLLPDNEACIIVSAGHCKLRTVYGDVTVITNKGIKYMNLHDVGINMVRELLGNPKWDTDLCY